MKKKQIYSYIKYKLKTDTNWQIKALLSIYDFQTITEQNSETTIIHNDVGFTGTDGHILSSFAKQWQKRNWLSNKQMIILSHKMSKYWHQIYNISNKDKLNTQTEQWVSSQPSEQLSLLEPVSESGEE